MQDVLAGGLWLPFLLAGPGTGGEELVAGRMLSVMKAPAGRAPAGHRGPKEACWPSHHLETAWACWTGQGASEMLHLSQPGPNSTSEQWLREQPCSYLVSPFGKTSLQLLREVFFPFSHLVSSWVTMLFLFLPVAPLWSGWHLASCSGCLLALCGSLGSVPLQGGPGTSRREGQHRPVVIALLKCPA